MKQGERFTILLPVHRPPLLLPFATKSVLSQTHADFELFIVCDGAPAATAEWAHRAARRDSRIRVFDFEKGARHGEAHRHIALDQATGTLIAHISDDDLWFPDHLAELKRLLNAVDFGNLLQVRIDPDSSVVTVPVDLADAATRQRMLTQRQNYFGLSVAGYRLSAYRTLPEGWAPAPEDVWTDLHMWRKFLSEDGLEFGTRFSVQSIHLAASQRPGMDIALRADEIRLLARRLRRPAWRREIAARGMKSLYHGAIAGGAVVVPRAPPRSSAQ